MTSISPTLPNNVSPLDLPSHYQSVRERLMNGRIKPKPAAPEPKPEIPTPEPKSCFRPHSNKRREILAIVAWKHRVSSKAIRGAGRSRALSAARQEAMWMMHELGGYSTNQIGIFFGRDHTTAMYSIRKFSTGIVRGVHKSRKPGKPEKTDGKSAKFSTYKTVEAGSISLAGEPRRHLPDPALARGPVSMPNVRSARQ